MHNVGRSALLRCNDSWPSGIPCMLEQLFDLLEVVKEVARSTKQSQSARDLKMMMLERNSRSLASHNCRRNRVCHRILPGRLVSIRVRDTMKPTLHGTPSEPCTGRRSVCV